MDISSTRKKWITAAVAAGALIGSAGIASALGGSSPKVGNTDNTVMTAAAGTGTGTDTATPHRNEDPTHEASETPAREADEAAGKGFGGGPRGDHHSNTDAAHEAAESPAHAAEEAAHDAAIGTVTTVANGG